MTEEYVARHQPSHRLAADNDNEANADVKMIMHKIKITPEHRINSIQQNQSNILLLVMILK